MINYKRFITLQVGLKVPNRSAAILKIAKYVIAKTAKNTVAAYVDRRRHVWLWNMLIDIDG